MRITRKATAGSTVKHDFVKGRESATALRMRYRIKPLGKGPGKHWVWVAVKEWFGKRDWLAYGGIALWAKRPGGGGRIEVDLGYGKGSWIVRYSFRFRHTSSEWRRIEVHYITLQLLDRQLMRNILHWHEDETRQS